MQIKQILLLYSFIPSKRWIFGGGVAYIYIYTYIHMPPNVRSFVADDASVLELAVPAMRFSGSNGPAAGIQQVESAGFFCQRGYHVSHYIL